MSRTIKVDLEQFAKVLWDNYEPRMGMPSFCETTRGTEVDPWKAEIGWEDLKPEDREWWRQLIVDCIVLEATGEREEVAGEISPDDEVRSPSEFKEIALIAAAQPADPYRAARQFERLLNTPVEIPKDPDVYALNDETIRVLCEVDALVQSRTLTDAQIGAALENIMGHCSMALEMYPGPSSARTEEDAETVTFIPAKNGGEVSEAYCYACRQPMTRVGPVALVFHRMVHPTLHSQFKCSRCLLSIVIEEDAMDVRTADSPDWSKAFYDGMTK